MNYTKKTSNNDNNDINADYAEFMSKATKRITKAKVRTLSFLDWLDDTHQSPFTPSMNANISKCASWLQFREYENHGHKLTDARFCKKDKVCPACAMRRASKQVQKVYNELYSNSDLLTGYWYYIVLPVKHNATEEFGTVYERLTGGLKKINQAIRNVNRGQSSDNFFTMFDGIMYSIEQTKTENGWNIHANLLCRSDTPINDLKLKPKRGYNKQTDVYWSPSMVKTWKELTGSINVSINPINVKSEDSLMLNLMEIFKYSLKFQDLKNEDLLIAYRGTYRKRLLGSMGSLRQLKTDVSLLGDDVKEDVFIESSFVWIRNKFVFRGHIKGRVGTKGFVFYEAEPYVDYG